MSTEITMKGGGGGGGRSYRKYIESQKKPKSAPLFELEETSDCDLDFETKLQKVTDAISLINIGDQLKITINNRIISVLNDENELIGNIVSVNNGILIECVKKGNSYIANIRSIDKKNCIVRVFRIKK